MTHRNSNRPQTVVPNVRAQRRSNGLPRFYAIQTVAEALEVSTRTVRRWIASGELIAHRVNGVLRIADADLHSFLARHRETLVLLSWIVMQCQRSTNYREYSMRILRISVLW